MKKNFLLPTLLSLVALGALSHAQESYSSFAGPTGEEWSRMGTDGTDLYFTTNSNELHRYSFSASNPTGGAWTQLASAPKNVNAWDSYRGLAFQGGYLYCTAETTPFGRTILRYVIATNVWEEWAGGNSCNSSGNGLFMHPTQAGVGISAWHGGGHWVTFDWNNTLADNSWLHLGGLLGVPDDNWISRNEEAVPFGDGLNYYGVKNDWTAGLSAGDVVYSFDLNGSAGTVNLIAQKPFQSGAGSSLEMVSAAHPLNTTGGDELWFYRGGDGLYQSWEGWSLAGTHDLGILDLATTTWTTYTTPFWQGRGTDSVMIGDLIFVKSSGSDLLATTYDDQFWVAFGATMVGYCFGDPGSGTPCPCINDNDGSVPGSGCDNGAFASGAKLVGLGNPSISNDTVVLSTTGLEPNNTGLYFQANNRVNSGDGNPFGDGLRCAGGGLIRLQVQSSDGAGASQTSIAIATKGMVSAGDTKRYQCWYRTIQNPPCGLGVNDFNLSNGLEIVWTP